MRVSWLIPVRDGAAWLAEAVSSALAQCEDDDEVVVVDDGSSDHPASVLPEDPRIVLLQQPPRGITAALEAGRARARGELIARLDADDVAIPGRIVAQKVALAADPLLVAVGGQARLVGSLGTGMARYVAWVNALTDLHASLLVESPLFHPAVTLRASALTAVGGWREGDFPEDYDLWLRLVAAGGRIAAVEQVVVSIRDRAERLTRTDPRYRRGAFTDLKMAHLAATRLKVPQRVVVWGAGRGGRRWIRWLLSEGHRVPVVIDAFCRTERQGVAVVAPERLADVVLDCLLVAVGARGARDEIRSLLAVIRPQLQEGRDWFAVC
ncbi:MAG: glycosyltransferase family 2 protein [Myxococcota bacterium]|nr:glycosyltransferase family 2 protein [Myxococcota bacterium]